MKSFWNSLIHPILLRLRPRCIVEIGSEWGATTRLLLEYCVQQDTILHTIDPHPRFDIATWEQAYKKHLVVHQLRSLEALLLVDGPDVVLIDGDHNWYTVINELKLLEERSREVERPFPFVFLHDIDWPYGRRDLYYDPKSIPTDFQHSFERKGILYGVSELQEKGGINNGLFNACHEGGPRNGVLTAVEDFLQTTTLPLRLITIPGFFGLGILYLPEIAHDSGFREFLQSLDMPPHLRRHVADLQAFGLSSQFRVWELLDKLRLTVRTKRHSSNSGADSVRR